MSSDRNETVMGVSADPDDDGMLFEKLDACPPKKRDLCHRCRRPMTVCWCPFLPNPLPEIVTNVVILQHPYEEKRSLSTTPMLSLGLPSSKCRIVKGTRFKLDQYLWFITSSKHILQTTAALLYGVDEVLISDVTTYFSNDYLRDIVSSEDTYLLYPTPEAVPISSLKLTTGQTCHYNLNLIVLDGTWLQAKGLYGKNKFLQNIKTVKIDCAPLSRYVIRTQPTDECLSTLESVAAALECLEDIPDLYQMLTKPLEALCSFQLSHGAVPHQSKEYLIKNGLYKSQKDKHF